MKYLNEATHYYAPPGAKVATKQTVDIVIPIMAKKITKMNNANLENPTKRKVNLVLITKAIGKQNH